MLDACVHPLKQRLSLRLTSGDSPQAKRNVCFRPQYRPMSRCWSVPRKLYSSTTKPAAAGAGETYPSMTTSVTLCTVPAAYWEEDSTHTLPQRAVFSAGLRDCSILERRLAKNVNATEERRRYASLCDSIEQFAATASRPCPDLRLAKQFLEQGHFPSLALDGSYIALLEACALLTNRGALPRRDA